MNYHFWLADNILAIEDLTNPGQQALPFERVLREIERQIGTLAGLYVLVKGRQGFWDALIRHDEDYQLYLLNESTFPGARQTLTERIALVGQSFFQVLSPWEHCILT